MARHEVITTSLWPDQAPPKPKVETTKPLAEGGRRLTVGEATIVKLPGTLARIYWPNGTVEDFRTVEEARAHVLR